MTSVLGGAIGLRVAFARAVVRPGGQALLLTPDNRADRWAPIEDAASTGRAYTVEVADNVLAIDADHPDLILEMEGIAAPEDSGRGHNSGNP